MALKAQIPSFLFGIFTVTMLLATSDPAFGAVRCEAQIRKALSEVNIQESDVKSIQVRRGGGGGQSSSNYKLDAWIRMNSCEKGYLMVTLSSSCHVHETYTKGDCKVSGLSQH